MPKSAGDGLVWGFVVILVLLALSNLGGCGGGCGGGGGSGGGSYGHGQDAGRLQSENARLQEAERQAAERLQVERHRSAQLVDEIGTRRHVEALMVGVVVLGGCALAVSLFTLVKRRRAKS